MDEVINVSDAKDKGRASLPETKQTMRRSLAAVTGKTVGLAPSDADAAPREPESGGPKGPEPTRYGDWERKGRCIDF